MCFCNLQVSKTQKVCLINDGVAFYSRLKYLYAAKGGETAIYTVQQSRWIWDDCHPHRLLKYQFAKTFKGLHFAFFRWIHRSNRIRYGETALAYLRHI